MTPGIQPSNVKMMLSRKLAIRPVISTATGGNTTQKKYRKAFTLLFLPSPISCVPALQMAPSAARNLRSLDSTTTRGKDGAGATQHLRSDPQFRSPCTCQSARSALLAFPNAALRLGLHCLADQAPPLLALRSPLRSPQHHIS